MRTNGGADAQSACMAGDVVGFAGTATATSSTSLTMTAAGWTTDAFIGHIITTGVVYGVITTNSATVATVDRWYQPSLPGGTVGTTPGNVAFAILPGNAPYWYMAITTNATAASATDTTLASEITTAGGGLIRKLATYAHTTGAASYSLAATFTVNGSDTGLPVTIAKIGIFNTLVGATGRMQFETVLGTSAVLSAVGDAVTITDTVSL